MTPCCECAAVEVAGEGDALPPATQQGRIYARYVYGMCKEEEIGCRD